ncbi:DUF4268 domain-containing protein [Capnocytophaga catalasegens]|uniref:DUF4268 domain-containing protein n=1 Tax=Capnocytophaga catalasegens TaxID=1004260 RepID=A0AAV5AWJ2_9FLAO|nr:DUF4268 domain-containing protein [Capnocytophaga catalasegens]GIZ16077.1 hypothetical protein RCZ03_20770 [Capnocytophaga catalasegens]GJM50236.1 hypothetical protein RCZ15_12090 [Capnocytophaga catalasegens]GJM53467.1 hypothetical protein RCZ16_17830 [Capnocytophaga catalasegens]
MFSKEESARIRQDFWTSFGKSFPRKWILYHTKIKELSFKFHFDTKKALVTMDIEGNLQKRIQYYEKMQALHSILEEYLPEIIYEDSFLLENGKEISRIYVEKQNVCIHNKNTWAETMEFLHTSMLLFEDFWQEYEDFIKATQE